MVSLQQKKLRAQRLLREIEEEEKKQEEKDSFREKLERKIREVEYDAKYSPTEIAKERTILRNKTKYKDLHVYEKKYQDMMIREYMDNRDTGDNVYRIDSYIDYSYDKEILNRIMEKFDLSKYLDANGKLNENFMRTVRSPNFSFEHLADNNFARVNFYMGNLNTQIVVALFILKRFEYFDIPIRYPFLNKLYDYAKDDAVFNECLSRAFLDNTNMRYGLVPERVYNKKGKLVEIKNPKNKQHRKIKADKRTAKQIYKKIQLREKNNVIKDINIDNVYYKVSKNCVHDYLSKFYGKKIVRKHLIADIPNYQDIFNLAEILKFSVYVYDASVRLIDKRIIHNSIKDINIMIHDNHMFVLKINKKKKKMINIIYHNKDDYNIDKYNDSINTKIILDNYDTFKLLLKKYNEKYSLLDFSENHFKMKNNCMILYDVSFKDNQDIIEDFESEAVNIYNLIESKLQLKGFMNNETYQEFKDAQNILHYKTNFNSNAKFDHNASYLSHFYDKTIAWPIPCINDYFLYYNNHKIQDHYFYEVSFHYNDEFIHTHNRIIYGRVLLYIKEIEKEDSVQIIKEIKKYFMPNRTKNINQLYLPTPDKKIETETIHFPKHMMIRYIGWLQSCYSVGTKKYTINDDEERLGFIKNNECFGAQEVIDKNPSWIQNNNGRNKKNDKVVTLNTSNLKASTGLLINIIIKDLTNLALYKFNRQFIIDNPKAKLNSIKVDSIGYRFKGDYKKNKYMNETKYGFFKIEALNLEDNEKNEVIKTSLHEKNVLINKKKVEVIKTSFHEQKVLINKREQIEDYEVKDIEHLISINKSFNLEGLAGFGKSHVCTHIIRPTLEKQNKEYIMTSTTICNTADHKDCCTFQSLIHNKSDFELLESLKNIDYIIIDEAVQLGEYLLKKVEFIKLMSNVQFIFLSDSLQCTYDDYHGKAFIDTYFCQNLLDNNRVVIKEHKNIRYDKELYKHIKYIIEHKNDISLIRDYVRENFKNKEVKRRGYDTKTNINLAWRRDTCSDITEGDIGCYTVHSYQGKTIKEDFTIHEWDEMPFRVLYTAISRGTTKDQIQLISFK